MKYFYISLFLSISFLVIGTAVSIEQKHSAAKAQAELLKAQELQEDDAPEAELENPMKVAPSIRRENDPRFRSGKISFRSSFGALVSDTMRV